MTEWIKLVRDELDRQRKNGSISPHSFLKPDDLTGLCRIMNGAASRFRAAAAGLKVDAYMAARGSHVVKRLRCDLPTYGVKTVPVAKDQVRMLIMTFVAPKMTGISWWARTPAYFVLIDVLTAEFRDRLQPVFDEALSKRLDDSKANAAASRNEVRSRERRRVSANKKLVRIIGEYECTEQEVLEAWNMSQIRKVQES